MKDTILNTIKTILIFILALTVCSSFRLARVDGKSMMPTLESGDILIVKAFGQPSDQDVVILTTEGKDLKTDYLVKRYIKDKSEDDEMWVEGDNKNNSIDSRFVGTFDKDNLIGIAIFDVTQMKGLK